MDQAQPVVTPDDVVRALSERENAPMGQFELYGPFVGQLVEIVGDDLNTLVTLSKFWEVCARFRRWLAGNREFLIRFGPLRGVSVPALFMDTAISFDKGAEDPQAVLMNMNLATEADYFMASPEFNASSETMALYWNGELTFARLLTTSPHVFLSDN